MDSTAADENGQQTLQLPDMKGLTKIIVIQQTF